MRRSWPTLVPKLTLAWELEWAITDRGDQKLVSVAVLAGGQSKRMGQNKAFLEVGGQRVIARVLDTVRTLTDDLFISTNTPEQYEQFGLRMVGDIYPDKATLGGIYSAIEAAHHHHVLVVACDMPFLKRDLLRYLLELAPTAEVVAPLITPPPTGDNPCCLQ